VGFIPEILVLLDVHGHENLVRYLNNYIFERSTDVIEFHEKQKQ
jgi:hypothetical protein